MALDARRKTDEADSHTAPSLRSVSPPKFLPFSRFHSTSSVSPPACSSHYVPLPLHYLNKVSEKSHTVPNYQVSSVSSPVLITTPLPSSNTTPLSFTPHHSNSHHSRFSSALSNLAPTSTAVPTTSSSRISKLLTPSHFRPPVTAVHRLSSWSSPYASRQRHQLESELSPSLADMAYRTVQAAFAPSTKSTYAAGVLRFNEFCDIWNVSEEARMPASAALLAAFVGQVRGRYAGGTVCTWLSGIRAWHVMHQADWHGDHEWVHNARVSANKEGTLFKRPLRAPVSLEHLHILRNTLNLSDPLHAAIWAVATITFFGCHRLGETTVKNASAFSPVYHVTRATAPSFRSLTNGSTSASIRIPWTKTTKHDGALIIITSRSDIFCPTAALHNHLTINCNAMPTISFFGFRNADNSWSHMFRDTFLSFVTKIWFAAAMDHVSGHSLRIGGAVELLLAGVPPEVVAATGGWTSLAFLLYWRRMEEIIPLTTSKAYNAARISSLSDIFEQFRIRQNISIADLDSAFLNTLPSHLGHPTPL